MWGWGRGALFSLLFQEAWGQPNKNGEELRENPTLPYPEKCDQVGKWWYLQVDGLLGVTKKLGKEERILREYIIMEDELGGRRKEVCLESKKR